MANFLKSLFVKGVEIDPVGATSNQVLKYNGTKFVPGTASTVGSIDDLSDVAITSPANNEILKYNSSTSLWTNASAGASGGAIVSDTAPASPVSGQLWFESSTGITYVYYDSYWVEIGAGASYDPITGIVQAKGDLILGTASQTVDRLTVGTNSQRLIANSSASTGVSWASDSTNTVIDTKGDLLVGATNDVVAKLPVGTNNQILVADSTATNGVSWQSRPLNLPWGVVAYTSNATQTITSGILIGLNTTFTFLANRYYKISTSNGWSITGDILLGISINGTGVMRYFDSRFATRSSTFLNASGFWVGTVAAGSKTVSITVTNLSGTTFNQGASDIPNQLIIEDIGPA